MKSTILPGMDRIVSAAEANRSFSALLRQVEAGETVVIAKHGRPVARISPAKARSMSERQAAKNALVDWMLSLPPVATGPITRDDGYE